MPDKTPENSNNRPFQNIYYRDKYETRLLQSDIRPLVIRLFNNRPQRGDKAKILNNYGIMSARVNKKIRLIYTQAEIDNKPCLVLLRVLDRHEYQSLKNDNFEGQISPYPLKNLTPTFHFGEETKYQLTHQQCEVLDTTLPLAINGSPGSGKSSTSLAKIAYFVENYTGEEPQTILYLAIQSNLTNSMQTIWDNSSYKQIAEEKQIQIKFRTYNQLSDVVNEPSQKEKSGWLNSEKKRLRALNKNNHNYIQQLNKIKPDSLFQEFNFIGCYSKETYCNKEFGSKNTLFSTEESRKIVFDLFKRYQEKFTPTRFSKLNVCEDLGEIALVICDETQDFSTIQLENILKLSNGKTIFCLDTNQSLTNTLSIRPHLNNLVKDLFKDLFKDKDVSLNSLSLEKNFRNPETVLNITNQLLKIERHLTGGRGDKEEYAYISQHPSCKEKGFAFLSQDIAVIREKALNSVEKHTELVVVAEKNQVEAAKKAFPEFLVLTPEQIKGLEYPVVLAYRPFSNEFFKNANGDLKTVEKLKENIHRPKNNDNKYFTPAFNAVITTFTRAMQGLLIYQESHGAEHIIRHLQIEENNAPEKVREKRQTTQEDWEQEFNKLIIKEKFDIALEIWTQKLNRPKDEFEKQYVPNKKAIQKPVAASSSQSKTAETLPNNLTKEIEALWNDFSEQKLIETLSKKNREQILFNRTSDGSNLCERIYNDPAKYDVLNQILNQKKHRQKFYTPAINSAIGQITNLLPNALNNRSAKKGKTNKITTLKNAYKTIFEQIKQCGLIIDDIYVDDKGTNLLMFSLLYSTENSIILDLINACKNIHQINDDGDNALHFACKNTQHMKEENRQTDHLNIVRRLIKAGVKINQKNNKGESALHLACENNLYFLEKHCMVKLLIENGANLNPQDENELTIALRSNAVNLFTYLLKLGCDNGTYKPQHLINIYKTCMDEDLFKIREIIHKNLSFDSTKEILFNTASPCPIIFYAVETLSANEFSDLMGGLPVEVFRHMLLQTDKRGMNLLMHTIENVPDKITTLLEIIAHSLKEGELSEEDHRQIFRQTSKTDWDVLMLCVAHKPDLFPEMVKIIFELKLLTYLLAETNSKSKLLGIIIAKNDPRMLTAVILLLIMIKNLPKQEILKILTAKFGNGLNAISFSAKMDGDYFPLLFNFMETSLDKELILEFLQSTDRDGDSLILHAIKTENITLAASILKLLKEKDYDPLIQRALLQAPSPKTKDSALHLAIKTENIEMIGLLFEHILTIKNPDAQYALLTERNQENMEIFTAVAELSSMAIFHKIKSFLARGLLKKLLRKAIEVSNVDLSLMLLKLLVTMDSIGNKCNLIKRENEDEAGILALATRSGSEEIITMLIKLIWDMTPEDQYQIFSEVSIDDNPLTYYLRQEESFYSKLFYGNKDRISPHIMYEVFSRAIDKSLGFEMMDNDPFTASYFHLKDEKNPDLSKSKMLLIFSKSSELTEKEDLELNRCSDLLEQISKKYINNEDEISLTESSQSNPVPQPLTRSPALALRAVSSPTTQNEEAINLMAAPSRAGMFSNSATIVEDKPPVACSSQSSCKK